MLETDRSDSWRRAFRVELRAQAIDLAWRGWEVLPGTYPAGSQWAGRDGTESAGPVPVHKDWQERIGTRPELVGTWWTGWPYSLLLATGYTFDAIEVGGGLGRRAAQVLRTVGLPAPIIATPSDRWVFLTKAGIPLGRELTAHDDVIMHGGGSWVALPPSSFQHGVVHWRVKPEVCGWNIPDSHTIQDALLDALAARATSRQLVTDRA